MGGKTKYTDYSIQYRAQIQPVYHIRLLVNSFNLTPAILDIMLDRWLGRLNTPVITGFLCKIGTTFRFVSTILYGNTKVLLSFVIRVGSRHSEFGFPPHVIHYPLMRRVHFELKKAFFFQFELQLNITITNVLVTDSC